MSISVEKAKSAVRAFYTDLDASPTDRVHSVIEEHLAPDVVWQGFRPLRDTTGTQDLAQQVYVPLKNGIGDFQRLTHILMGGISDGSVEGGNDGKLWVGATGYFCGTQVGPIWGIPGQGQVRLRWSDFLEFDESGRIVRIQCIIDVVDWLEQLGKSPLPKSTGVDFVWPAPTGVLGDPIAPSSEAENEALLAYGRQFIFGGLNAFDQSDLKSMGMADFFHQNLKWYGPGGIGACLSLKEFEDLHQRPWLVAFPDRQVGDLDNLIAEGGFVGASSMPGVWLTHTGQYLGHEASNKRAGVNGIDFWKYENGQFTENWVFVDMVDLFAQFGVDLLKRVRQLN